MRDRFRGMTTPGTAAAPTFAHTMLPGTHVPARGTMDFDQSTAPRRIRHTKIVCTIGPSDERRERCCARWCWRA